MNFAYIILFELLKALRKSSANSESLLNCERSSLVCAFAYNWLDLMFHNIWMER